MNRLLSYVFACAVLAMVGRAGAQTLLYSFEGGTDGFGPNGGGTVTQDTIGATDGTHSLKETVPAGAFFVGALTGTVPPALNDPTLSAITVDVNVPANYAGAFADIGVTIFGEVGGNFGYQYQVDPSSEKNVGAAGQFSFNIPLVGQNPVTFDPSNSYAQVQASGFVPTGFEFFVSKSSDAPLTVYYDNVQAVSAAAGTVPEPTSLGLIAVGSLLLVRRRRAA
jgi:hypothetical protein